MNRLALNRIFLNSHVNNSHVNNSHVNNSHINNSHVNNNHLECLYLEDTLDLPTPDMVIDRKVNCNPYLHRDKLALELEGDYMWDFKLISHPLELDSSARKRYIVQQSISSVDFYLNQMEVSRVALDNSPPPVEASWTQIQPDNYVTNLEVFGINPLISGLLNKSEIVAELRFNYREPPRTDFYISYKVGYTAPSLSPQSRSVVQRITFHNEKHYVKYRDGHLMHL